MSVTAADVAGRVHRLTETLAELKDRVRSAVAGEAGKAVGEAIRDLLTASLTGRMASPRPMYLSSRPVWDDDRGGWEDDDSRRHTRTSQDRWQDDDDDAPRSEPPMKSSTTWPAALAVGATAVRWWIARRVPGWAALGLGVVVGVTAFAGGPIARAGLALFAAAADLVPTVHPLTEWGLPPHST